MLHRHARSGGIVSIVVASIALGVTSTSQATWSICVADCETKEVAVGTVTCLTQFDLLKVVPAVVVGKGTGAVLAGPDFDGLRRSAMFDGLMQGVDPEEILETLSKLPFHQQRQYGIVDTQCRMVTFTGSANFQWAGGVIARQGSIVYAIQGNVLAGECVVMNAAEAILTTPGDLADRLMAGMEAARAAGGDGRCSCDPFKPDICGCPPPDFEKSGHVGGMIVARIGDTHHDACTGSGCADGDYFMVLNVPFQPEEALDPVLQLQAIFDAWRQSLIGVPDAIHSTVEIDPPCLFPDGASTTTMTITLLDWQQLPITRLIESITVEHAPESDGLSTIGPVIDLGGGEYAVEVTAGATAGIDRFRIVVDDGIRPVTLMPDPALALSNLTDFDVEFGSFQAGDLCDLALSDDVTLSTRSSFGLSALDANLMELIVGAITDRPLGETMTVTVESRLNNPNGLGRARLRNWENGLLEQVGEFGLMTTDDVVTIEGIEPASYVRAADGRIELSLRYSAIATFSLAGFDAFFDMVGIAVD